LTPSLASLASVLSKALGVSLEDLIGNGDGKPPRRGPTPKLQRQLERLSRLPRAQQQVVSRMLDGVLVSAGAEQQ
jgi:hypothetical protein